MDRKDYEIQELSRENEVLRKRNIDLLEENDRLQEENKHLHAENVRLSFQLTAAKEKRPGKRFHDQAWQMRYMAVSDLLQEGKSPQEIMQELSMSKTTFYRYRKQFLRDLGLGK